MKNVDMNFIPQNVAPIGAKQVAIFDSDDNLVATLPLGGLTHKHQGEKKYSFGALSDVHLPYAAQNASTDFQKALTYFNNVANVDFICISGDMSDKGTDAEWLDYKNHVDAYSPNIPVHLSAGNHDVSNGNMSYDYPVQYTGNPLWYSFEQNNDVFIMFGLRQWQGDNVFHNEALQWLYETLEENKDKRCFVFQHEMRLDGCGNGHGLYGWDGLSGRNGQVFLSLMEHYKNVIWFHGHSHTPFKLQNVQPTPIANYDRLHGCHSVHIPSLAIPRYGNSDVIFDAEGYVVDVYENGIHLRGIDFIEEEFVPIASYWIDTTPVEITGEYIDDNGIIKPESITLPENAELVMNERYSHSGGGYISDSIFFVVTIPVKSSTQYMLTFDGLEIPFTVNGCTLYCLDENKSNAKTVNGNSNFSLMTSGVTILNDGKGAEVEFETASDTAYIAISIVTEQVVTEESIKDYVITIDENSEEAPEEILKQGDITDSVTWTMDKRLSSAGDPDKDLAGSMVSDFIAVNANDVINIYGITSLTTSGLYINFYKDGTFVYNIPLGNPNCNPTDSNYAYAEYSARTLHLTVQIKDVNSVNSIRVSCVASAVTVYRNAEEEADPIGINLLDEYEVHMNERWSSSSNAGTASNGVIYLEVPYSVIKDKTIRIMGFEPEDGGTSTWYVYDVTKTLSGRIANPLTGTIWRLDDLRNNGDGSYEADISNEIFFSTTNSELITFEPDIIKITMKVSNDTINSLNGLYLLVIE